MSGLGRKVFAAGEILTAADLQGYAVDQSVMVFAGTAARGSAIPSPTEGMVTYLSDVDTVQVFDGSTFKPVGGLVDVKSALKTDTESFTSVAGGANVAVTGLSITHEVADASNKLIITAYFGAAANSNGSGSTGIAVAEDGTLIGVGATAGSRTSVGAGGFIVATTMTSAVAMPSVTFVRTPGAGSKTYTVRAINISTATNTLFVNRAELDTDAGFATRAASALVIQEVSV